MWWGEGRANAAPAILVILYHSCHAAPIFGSTNYSYHPAVISNRSTAAVEREVFFFNDWDLSVQCSLWVTESEIERHIRLGHILTVKLF